MKVATAVAAYAIETKGRIIVLFLPTMTGEEKNYESRRHFALYFFLFSPYFPIVLALGNRLFRVAV